MGPAYTSSSVLYDWEFIITIAANIWKRKVGMIYAGAWHAAHGQGWVSRFCELFAKLMVATISDLS